MHAGRLHFPLTGKGLLTMEKMPMHLLSLEDFHAAPSEANTTKHPQQVETAGDCYIAAGGLTITDEDGFIRIDPESKPDQSAQRVLAFAKVRTPATLLPLRTALGCMPVAGRAPAC